MTDLITKLNTAIAVLNDAKHSLAKQWNSDTIQMFLDSDEAAEYKLSKEDSKESVIRRLVVVRGMLNEINRELKGRK